MNRREILKYTAMLTGTAIIAPLSASMLTGCTKKVAPITNDSSASATTATQFFEQDTFILLTKLMDTILPKTDTPSASDVQVHLIMDNMFAQVFTAKYQQRFLKQFAALSKHLDASEFHSASDQEQVELLRALETMPNGKKLDSHNAYMDIKQQTIAYYLSTEEIAENHLNYMPIPGQYKPCVTVEEVGGKAWAI